MQLSNIRIVLVRTFHPGNIGSAARSMKTMGLSDLALVAPKQYPDPEAQKMAASAEDLLANATMHQTLEDALAPCTAIVAATARPRGYDLPELNPEQTAELLLTHSANHKVALVFGPERMGLHNSDIQLAKYRVSIPAHPEYSSLNLAAAVQTLSYEIYKQSLAHQSGGQAGQTSMKDAALPSSDDMLRFYVHLEQVMRQVSFLRPHQGETPLRLKTLFSKAQLTQSELNILRGFLRSMQRSLAGETKQKRDLD